MRAAPRPKRRVREQVCDTARLALRVAVLEQDPAAGLQVSRGAGDDPGDGFEARRAGVERRVRLEAPHRRLDARVALGDVGRVARDQVEAHRLARARTTRRCGNSTRSRPRRCRIARGHRRSRRRNVGAGHAAAGSLARDRKRDRAAARREVQHVERPRPAAGARARARRRVRSPAAGSARTGRPRAAGTRTPSRRGCRRPARRAPGA